MFHGHVSKFIEGRRSCRGNAGLHELRQKHYNYQAHAVLRSIEGQQGPTDKRLVKLANAYSRDVFGSIKYAPWLRVYAAISGGFKEGWIPDNYYGIVVDP